MPTPPAPAVPWSHLPQYPHLLQVRENMHSVSIACVCSGGCNLLLLLLLSLLLSPLLPSLKRPLLLCVDYS